MKQKRQDPLARRNRANKNRGREFENRCAKVLGWTRVPYSGAQAHWGKGDVVDGFYTRDGLWRAECKITIGGKTGISINGKWIKQMGTFGGDTRYPVLFFARKGSPRSWALLPVESWDFIQSKFPETQDQSFICKTIESTPLGTFGLDQASLDSAWNGHNHRLQTGEHLSALYYLISFPYFVELVTMLDIHKPIEDDKHIDE